MTVIASPVSWRGECLQTEFGDEIEHRVLAGAHPLATHLDRHAVAQKPAEVAARDTITGLEDPDGLPGGDELAGRGEPGESSSDYDDIDV